MPTPDFVLIPRNGAGVDLIAVSSRARAFLAARKSTGFSRRGVKEMVEAGWVVVTVEEYRAECVF